MQRGGREHILDREHSTSKKALGIKIVLSAEIVFGYGKGQTGTKK